MTASITTFSLASDEYYVTAKGDPDTRSLSNALNILLMKMHVLATKKGLNDSLTAVAEQVAAGAGFATKGLEKALLTYDAYAYSIAKCLYDHFEADVPEDRRASVRYILPSSILQNRVNNANTAHNVSERRRASHGHWLQRVCCLCSHCAHSAQWARAGLVLGS